jgi:hypothetical protein
MSTAASHLAAEATMDLVAIPAAASIRAAGQASWVAD